MMMLLLLLLLSPLESEILRSTANVISGRYDLGTVR